MIPCVHIRFTAYGEFWFTDREREAAGVLMYPCRWTQPGVASMLAYEPSLNAFILADFIDLFMRDPANRRHSKVEFDTDARA